MVMFNLALPREILNGAHEPHLQRKRQKGNLDDKGQRNETDQLITKVQAKLDAGKRTQTDLADELKEFDALLDKHKNEKCNLPLQIELLTAEQLFFAHAHLHGGPAPVRRFLPDLIDLVWNRKINPGKVFDLTLPLDQVAEGYRAMDERRAVKALLRP
jgi:hypothetical protein